MNTQLFSQFVDAVRSFNGNPQDASLQISSEGKISVFYAPTEWVNPHAKIIIVGITPGPTQAINFLTEAQRQLRLGASTEAVLMHAKKLGGFSGNLRANLVAMLDKVGLPRWAQISSSSELFGERTDLVQTASVLPYPVFVGDKPYSGAPSLLRSPLLRSMMLDHFLTTIQAIPEARLLAVGTVPFDALNWLAQQGHIAPTRILGCLPHPSGASQERINYFLGKKAGTDLSAKTDAAKLDVMRSHLERSLSGSPA